MLCLFGMVRSGASGDDVTWGFMPDEAGGLLWYLALVCLGIADGGCKR
jgi:hypothetical protein